VADARIDRLRSVPLFASCTDKELSFIASRVDEVDIPAGQVLTKKGESGGDFFIILEGKAEVEAAEGKRALGPGDFFGEIALLDNGPRTATVKAATPMRCLVLGHERRHRGEGAACGHTTPPRSHPATHRLAYPARAACTP
jgi:CRP-like cAMP-binding protein